MSECDFITIVVVFGCSVVLVFGSYLFIKSELHWIRFMQERDLRMKAAQTERPEE